jgi:uncharacterized protein YdiU (UPF0061 family)
MPFSEVFSPARDHEALGGSFFDPVQAAAFPLLRPRWQDHAAARRVGLGSLTAAEWAQHFGHFSPLPGSLPRPLALRYHGHQFRSYNPDLGDGRGFLFAQCREPESGRLLDFGTKGSGQTPWSRGGDGRLTLKGGVREVLATQLLAAQGVPTSRSFSLFETGEKLHRGDEPSPTRSSVLVRLSHGHIRIGSFQRQAYLEDTAALETLLRYAARTYYPHLPADGPVAELAEGFLAAVIAACARMTAGWMAAGFVHGVLNSDNINITGESFDYGPWRWLAICDPGFTAAYFDQTGLYAYGRQPAAVLWNLTRLAECFLPWCPEERLTALLDGWTPAFQAACAAAVLRRLGLAAGDASEDLSLAAALFRFLQDSRCGFEQFFFDWYAAPAAPERPGLSPQSVVYATAEFQPLRNRLLARVVAPAASPDHPWFDRPGPATLLIGQVEDLWAPIADHDDWQPLYRALSEIAWMAEAYGNGPLTDPLADPILTEETAP